MSKEPQLLVVPPGGTRSPFDELVVGSHVAVSRTEWQGLVAGGARVNLTEEKVAHLLRAEPRSRGDFLSSGMYGGHYDPNLQEFVAANPEFAIVLQGPPATAGGVQFRHYRQYRWNDATMPPPRPGDPLYPTVTSVDPRWEAAAFPKTTFSDPQAFLAYANTRIEAFRADLVTAGAAAKSGTAGHMLAGQPTIGVHYTFTPPDTLEIRSVFIDETWIQATAAAQRTPTPVPTGAKQ
jgi:hypothetical protein